MNSIFQNIVFLSIALINSSLAYSAEEESISVRGGNLTISGDLNDMKLFINRKLRDGNGFSLSFVEKYAVSNTDVVLIMNNSGGTACPVQYFFVSITSQGATKLSPEFGTCSDLAKPIQKGGKIIVSMPKMNDRGDAKYVYQNDTLYENGKAIKGVQQ